MHGYKKKLLDSNPESDKKKEGSKLKSEELSKSLPDSKSEIDPIQNPSHVPLSEKLEDLRKSFQDELDTDAKKEQNRAATDVSSDVVNTVRKLEQRLEKLGRAFHFEVSQKNDTKVAPESIDSIEKRLDILRRMFETEIYQKHDHQVDSHDFERLEKRIDILKKMFETEFNKKTNAKALSREVQTLEQKFDELQRTFHTEILEKDTVESMANDIAKLDNAIGTIHDRFFNELNDKLSGKASVQEINLLEQQLHELKDIVQTAFEDRHKGDDIQELSENIEEVQTSVAREVLRIEEGLNDLRKVFQAEFNNNTDARILARDLRTVQDRMDSLQRVLGPDGESVLNLEVLQKHMREVDNRFDAFQHEMKDAFGSGQDNRKIQQQFEHFEQRFQDLSHKVQYDLEKEIHSGLLTEQVKALKNELNDLRNIIHQELSDLKSEGGEVPQADFTNFKAFEDQFSDFKRTVIYELDKKSNSEALQSVVGNIEHEFDEIRAKVQIALEHSADSKTFHQEIEKLEQGLADMRVTIEKTGNSKEDLDSLSEDLGQFVKGLDYLRKDFEAQSENLLAMRQDFSAALGKVKKLETSQAETLRLTAGLKQFEENYKTFQKEIESSLETKGDAEEFLGLIQEISDVFEGVQVQVTELAHDDSKISDLSEDVLGLQGRLDEIQQKVSANSDIQDIRLSLEGLKEDMSRLSSDAETIHHLTQELEGLKETVSEIQSVKQDYQTVSEDVQQIEKDIADLKESRHGDLAEDVSSVKERLDVLQRDFQIEFDKLAESQAIYQDLPKLEQALTTFKESVQNDLEGKVYREDFKETMDLYEKKLKDIQVKMGEEFDRNTDIRKLFTNIPQMEAELKALKENFKNEYEKITASRALAKDAQTFEVKLQHLTEEIQQIKPGKEIQKIETGLDGVRKALAAETLRRKQKIKNVIETIRPRPKKFYLTAGIVAVSVAFIGLGLGVRWMDAKMVPAWENELENMQDMSSMKLDRFLTSERMQNLIDTTARNHTQAQIDNTFKRGIEVYIDLISKKVTGLVTQLEADADTAMARLNDITDFSALTADALNGSREAYDEIAFIAVTPDHPFNKAAKQVRLNVFTSITALNENARVSLDREPVRYKKMSRFKKDFDSAADTSKPDMLVDLWGSQKISKDDKVDFLVDIIARSPSLLMIARACELVDQEAGLYKPFIEYPAYLKWWNQERFESASFA